MLVVQLVPEQKQPVLLREEQENQAHHHRYRCFVELCLADVLQKLPAGVGVGTVERLDENFDGSADLGAQLVRDLRLIGGRLRQHRFERVRLVHSEKAANVQ